ncbi:adenosine deaminase [Alteromonas sp. a30]|nr:adenosine deaminase [Alteromonas sp. a30]
MAGCASNMSTNARSPALNDNFSKTKALFEDIVGSEHEKPEISKLNLFLTRMPKGGDLHHHYSGTIYAETYLDWVKEKGWHIDSCNFKIITDASKADPKCQTLTVDELLKQDPLYRKLLTLWSDKDFSNHFHEQVPPDSNFFNTFGYFGAAANVNQNIGVKIIKARALAENVSYIETQYSRTGVKSKHLLSDSERQQFINTLLKVDNQQDANATFDSIVEAYAKTSHFNQGVNDFVEEVRALHEGIDDENFTMRYQTYTARVQDPLQVFTELYSGFLATDKSELLVGVNIVAPENNHVALRDYTLHMYMFNYLSAKYPHVKKALHAGELTLGMVRPKDLLFHMKQAREIAGANRIGHGIDIPYEQDALAQLQDLKENAAVEINLTSNEFILGVSHEEHPYLIYEDYGVPMVISTDDSGVSRNNLTNEYVLLATRYKPNYEEIKDYVYNSIKYSFMSKEDKAKNKQRLDTKFSQFESEMAQLYEKL